MNINSASDLYHFLVGHGLSRMCPEAQNFITAMEILSRMCACDPPAAKAAQSHICHAQYVNFCTRAQSYAQAMLEKVGQTKIFFYNNGQLIGSVGRG